MIFLMTAPNGARLGKHDHPAIPITQAEIVDAAVTSADAGADALHLHVRDAEGRHSLDAGLYRATMAAIEDRLGSGFPIQISTETLGAAGPEDVVELLQSLKPASASVAFRNIAPDSRETPRARRLFDWARDSGVAIQHTITEPEDLAALETTLPYGAEVAMLFVLGRQTPPREAAPSELLRFLNRLEASSFQGRAHWMVCAHGRQETRCLTSAATLGGACRVGLENNAINADGSRAQDNAERVVELRKVLDQIGGKRPSRADIHRKLGGSSLAA